MIDPVQNRISNPGIQGRGIVLRAFAFMTALEASVLPSDVSAILAKELGLGEDKFSAFCLFSHTPMLVDGSILMVQYATLPDEVHAA